MKHVVVTTKHRGVFFGKLVSHDRDVVVLKDARNVLYWDKSAHGFLGLAAKGPSNASRVGPSVPELTLNGVTSLSQCTDVAVAAWESEPWK